MISPVWRATFCGGFEGELKRTLNLEPGDESFFLKILELACGLDTTWNEGLSQLIQMGKMADRYQIEPVQVLVEEAILACISAENCGAILMEVSDSSLRNVEAKCREIASSDFYTFAKSQEGLMAVDADLLESLLEDDNLNTHDEEEVLKTLLEWIESRRSAHEDALDSSRLMRKVRFPWMRKEFIETQLGQMCPELIDVQGVVQESLLLQSTPTAGRSALPLRHLDPCCTRPRHSYKWVDRDLHA